MLLTFRHQKFSWVVTLGLLVAFQAVGWHFFWGVLVVEAKTAARHCASSSEITLQRLTISATDLASLWVDQQEIRFQGRLYDVRRQWTQGDSICLEVYHDRLEESLYSALHTLLSSERPSATPLHNWLLQWVGSVYLPPLLSTLMQRLDTYVAARFCYYLLAAQHQIVQPTPPPRS